MFVSRLGRILFACSILGLAQVPILSQKLTAPIPVEDLLKSWSFANRSTIDLSPDGQFVAYTLQSQSGFEAVTDKRYAIFNRRGVSIDAVGRTVWVTDTKSGKSERPIDSAASTWGVSWSPDNRYLAFFSDQGGYAALWIWERSSRKAHQVSKLFARPIFGFEVPQWTPDSQKVLVKVMPEGMTIEDIANLLAPPPEAERPKSDTSSVIVYPQPKKPEASPTPGTQTFVPAEGLRNRTLADLALIDVESGNVQRLIRKCSTNAVFISPDGARVAFINLKGTIPGAQGTVGDITVISLRDGKSRVVAADIKNTTGRELSWSPDGQALAYITTRYPGAGSVTTGDCYLVSTAGGAPRKLTTGEHPNFGANYEYSRPLWDKTGKNLFLIGNRNLWTVPIAGGPARQITHDLTAGVIELIASVGAGRVWSPDGKSVYVSVRNPRTSQAGFFKIDVVDGQTTKLIERDASFGSPNFRADISDDEETVVYTQQDAQNYEDLWLAAADFSSPRRITHTNPQLDKYEMGRSRLVEWQTETGEQLRGALLLPSGYQEGKHYPTIVEVYGGDDGSAYANLFGIDDQGGVANKQLLATRGYAVFRPDIPMGVGSPMRDIARAVLPGVKKIIAMGIADPERLGVTGYSYGGYCTMAIIVQSNIFKAAVSRSGKANLITSYGTMTNDGNGLAVNWAETGQGRMGGTPWQYRERYIENSPFFYFDRVTTPVLVVAGGSDTGVPAFLQDEIFIALRRLGKEVVYAKYLGGGHGESSFDRADSIDYFNRMIVWFDKYLKAPKTEGSMQ